MIVKIARRTLEILSEAIEAKKLREPTDYSVIRKSLSKIVCDLPVFSVGSESLPEIQDLLTSILRIEMRDIDRFFSTRSLAGANMSTEASLLDYFQSIKHAFSELSATKFFVLFDDAGSPNLPREAQYIVSDLMFSSNSVYWVKISAERNTFRFITSERKSLEEGHDYVEHDISTELHLGSRRSGVSYELLEQYFRNIVDRRLKHFGYSSHHIVEYLGDGEGRLNQLLLGLVAKRKNAYYAGWHVVWRVADRTPRNLLEIVSEILNIADVDPETTPQKIDDVYQHRAIQIVSERRLNSLTQIGGSIVIRGEKVSLSSMVYDFTRALGSIFRIYLRAQRGKRNKRSHIALERNDSHPIGSEASEMLQALITYGVLDDSISGFARDDGIKKRIYVLNKIFCPAFGLFPQRDDHLKLSKDKFERLLLEPIGFVEEGTRTLRDYAVFDRNGEFAEQGVFNFLEED
jgi:hypothetical protein